MASVFTFDPDPPRVSSPWPASVRQSPKLAARPDASSPLAGEYAAEPIGIPGSDTPEDGAVTRLAAEPQEGPTEYKLHLLLRPRRSFSATSTGKHVSGSHHSKSASPIPRSLGDGDLNANLPMAYSTGSRQHRLEQLTTQLLWRLQQSSPFHSSSTNTLILPTLPEATPELTAPAWPAKLLPGLEESQGALYEIGVSDDGTFVGLTGDEMDESLNNLRAMAASLGCSVEILRMVPVGDCEWVENSPEISDGEAVRLTDRLWVAEAYIKPELQASDAELQHKQPPGRLAGSTADPIASDAISSDNALHNTKDQIRVSLTGATTSGKSSLLGTLSTSTLDNGRGKSRLSLLKHRHEIASGMTSSVAQELIGYCEDDDDQGGIGETRVINYAAGNVSSWNDIHASPERGRLVFLSDSAGHPRYLRTIVRGLVGRAPHWTLLCIPANGAAECATESGDEAVGAGKSNFPGANAHLSMAYLELCLKLNFPFVVVITKLDVAVKANLRQTLSTLLTALKEAGRRPVLLSNDNATIAESDLQKVPPSDLQEVQRLIPVLESDGAGTVPIVFTSAVRGAGMGKLHALLRCLPIRPARTESQMRRSPLIRWRWPGEDIQQRQSTVFHIDDIFNTPLNKSHDLSETGASAGPGSIISGYVARGNVSVGDEILLGPFSDSGTEPGTSDSTPPVQWSDQFLAPRSFTDALARATSSPKISAMPLEHEWRRVKIVSVRNLRLPVRSLENDQVGTVGIVPLDGSSRAPVHLHIRKGMVLTDGAPRASHTVTASFKVENAGSIVVGSLVTMYCASVRAPAKVVAVALENHDPSQSRVQSPERHRDDVSDDGFGFELDGDSSDDEPLRSDESILVTLQFTTHRHFIEAGSQVLVIPGGGSGLPSIDSGRGGKGMGSLDGFVGSVVQLFG